MKKYLLYAAAITLSACLSTGCTGNSDANPGRIYLEPEASRPVGELALELPARPLDETASVRLYACENGVRSLAKDLNYPARSVTPQQILAELPEKGQYYLEIALQEDSGRRSLYRAELKEGELKILR
ncbi:hypothetical protein IJT93_08470 [bacterium]|nr:hypothetical protein [bacterium]